MIEINGKEYRNLQEQVLKNMNDIEDLKKPIHNVTIFFEITGEKWYVSFKVKNASSTAFASASEAISAVYANHSSSKIPASGYKITTNGGVTTANPILYVQCSQTQIVITVFSMSNATEQNFNIGNSTFTQIVDQVL